MAYFVDGPFFQFLDCGNDNVVGGTTGIVSIWLTPVAAPECADGVDNADLDTAVDWPADRGCDGFWDTSEVGVRENGVDDDADGFTDFAADVGCDGNNDSDNSETGPCQDGADNDGDGFRDFDGGGLGFAFRDPQCGTPGVPDPNDGSEL